jgi:hypothetical protein
MKVWATAKKLEVTAAEFIANGFNTMKILVNSNDVQKHFSCSEDNRSCCCHGNIGKQ